MIRFLTYLIFSLAFTTNTSKPILKERTSELIPKKLEVTDSTFLKELTENFQALHDHFQPEKVYVQLDRSLYQPGETIWFTAFVRNAETNLPSDASEILHVDFFTPQGAVVKRMKLNIEDGMAKGDILIDADLNGGWYTMKAYTLWQTNLKVSKDDKVGFEKEILIQKSVLPNLRMKLDFQKESYTKGDVVEADLELKTLDNSELRYQEFDYVVSLQGNSWKTEKGKTDFYGNAKIKFQLPKNLSTNDGLLNVIINYNGLTESISRAIPIVLNDIDLQFMPEGGYLLANVDNQVAFKALDEFGEPADVEGIVLNEKGKQVATFSTYHQGMGKFEVKPTHASDYSIKITKPTGINKVFSLKMPKNQKVIGFQVSDQKPDAVKVKVFNQSQGNVALIAHANGKIYNTELLTPTQPIQEVNISTKNMPAGIMTLTLFDDEKRPHTERLVFVNHHKRLNISIQTNKQQYLPREKVKMDISVRDHLGNPVSGELGLSVVDDKLLSFADDKQANIFGYMLLQSELKGEVKEANFYFTPPSEGRGEVNQLYALDLLMMTQGWRQHKHWEMKNLNQPLAQNMQPAEKRYIRGNVKEKYGNKNIKNATVKIPSLNLKTTTDENGNFTFENIIIGAEPLIIEIRKGKDKINFIQCQNYGQYNIRYETREEAYVDANYRRSYYPRPRRSSNSGNITVSIQKNAVPNNKAMISGQMLDGETGEGLIFAAVSDNQRGIGAMTDIDGKFRLKDIEPGKYTFTFAYVGYSTIQKEVELKEGEHIIFEANLGQGMTLDEVVVVSALEGKVAGVNVQNNLNTNEVNFDALPNQNKAVQQLQPVDNSPVIQMDKTTSGKVIIKNDIQNLPSKSIAGIVATTAGVASADEGALSIRGSRANATIVYVDGIRVNGTVVPQTEVEQISVLDGGIPASYNDGAFIGVHSDVVPSRPTVSPTSVAYYFENFQKRLAYRNYSAPLYFLDGKLLPKEIAPILLKMIDPKVVKKFKHVDGKAGEKRYGEGGKNGAYILKTSYKKHPEIPHYKSEIKDWLNVNEMLYNTQVQLFNEKNQKIAHIVNGLETPQQSMLQTIREVSNKHQKLVRLEDELKGMAKFVRQKVNIKEDLPKLTDADKYLYALNFKNGLYQPREYYVPKYKSQQTIKKSARNDFRSTIYWNPAVQLNKNGKATVEFYTNDAITTFKATIEGIGENGTLGRQEETFFSEMPFGMVTKVPTLVLTGDEMKIPLTLMNNTEKAISGQLTVEVPKGFYIKTPFNKNITLTANEKKTLFLHYQVTKMVKDANLKIAFDAKGVADEFEQPLTIMERGFPVQEVKSSVGDSTLPIVIQEAMDSTIQGKLTLYPSTVSDIIETAKRMIRQPTGCFEQTSSSNYPNILVYNYLQKINKLDAATKSQLDGYLASGYKRLTGYEVKGGGFEWFGKPAAHEGLTAMGLMQFVDMSKVYQVSPKLIDRTAEWLMSRKDGQGSWKYKSSHYHSWDSDSEIADAYMIWALSRAGYAARINAEVDKSYQDAIKTKDPYIMALVADALFLKNDNRGASLFEELLKLQNLDGSWKGEKMSITRSGSESLRKETTALAAIAWMSGIKNGQVSYGDGLARALNCLKKGKSYYGFGTTQATILTLRAMIDFENVQPTIFDEKNRYTIFINHQKIMDSPFPEDKSKPIVIEGLGHYLKNGNNQVKVLFSNEKATMPFDFEWTYTTTLPIAKNAAKVNIKTTLSQQNAKVGETVRLSTTIRNASPQAIPNTVAIVGIPSGLSLQPWQLKDLMDKEVFDFYELMDGYIVFHYRGMAASAEKVIHLDLKADIPGNYEAPATNAYLYYADEKKHWEKGLAVSIEQ